MDTENIRSTFLSFLMIAVVLLPYGAEGVSLSSSISTSQQNSLCKKASQTAVVKDQPSEVKQGDKKATSTQSATSVSSCSISLQVIPAEKQYVLLPGRKSFVFLPYTPAISSQAFVFQEPDPPQTI